MNIAEFHFLCLPLILFDSSWGSCCFQVVLQHQYSKPAMLHLHTPYNHIREQHHQRPMGFSSWDWSPRTISNFKHSPLNMLFASLHGIASVDSSFYIVSSKLTKFYMDFYLTFLFKKINVFCLHFRKKRRHMIY